MSGWKRKKPRRQPGRTRPRTLKRNPYNHVQASNDNPMPIEEALIAAQRMMSR